MSSNAQPRSFSTQEYREDIIFLRNIFPRIDRSFTNSSLRRFHTRLTKLLDHIGELTFTSFAMGVAHCLSSADNAHTMPVLQHQLRVAPLRLHWFSDGLYVVRSLGGPPALVGARIDRIEGRPPED